MLICVVKPLQMVQNAASHLVFNQPNQAHITPLLHLLPVAVHMKFKSLMLTRLITGYAPIYLNKQVHTSMASQTILKPCSPMVE